MTGSVPAILGASLETGTFQCASRSHRNDFSIVPTGFATAMSVLTPDNGAGRSLASIMMLTIKAGCNLGVIEVSRKLSRYWTIVERKRPDIAAALITFVGVDSETDALPIGPVRQLWDPTALEAEDRKIEQAEGYYRELVKRACDEILACSPDGQINSCHRRSAYRDTAVIDP